MSELRKTITIVNQRGLHARASAKLVEVTTRWPEATEIQVAKDGRAVDGRSILDLMMLGAAMGDQITIKATGPDAAQALSQLVTLVEDKFGEE